MLKKGLTIGVVVLFLSISVIPDVVSDAPFNGIIYVDDDGGADYTRIQDAIDNASDGDTIFVYSGTYYGEIWINKSIHLIGENRTSTIISCEEYDLSRHMIRMVKEGAVFDNFTVTDGNRDGLLISHTNNCTVINNIFSDIKYSAIELDETGHNLIKNNYIHNVRYGIDTSHDSNNCTIINNTIVNVDTGIQILNDNKIIGNLLLQIKERGIDIGSLNLIKNNHINLISPGEPSIYNPTIGISNGFYGFSNLIISNQIVGFSIGYLGSGDVYMGNNQFIENNFIDNYIHAIGLNMHFILVIPDQYEGNYWSGHILPIKIIPYVSLFLLETGIILMILSLLLFFPFFITGIPIIFPFFRVDSSSALSPYDIPMIGCDFI